MLLKIVVFIFLLIQSCIPPKKSTNNELDWCDADFCYTADVSIYETQNGEYIEILDFSEK